MCGNRKYAIRTVSSFARTVRGRRASSNPYIHPEKAHFEVGISSR
ncbi:MAG: hypothetical protein ACLSAP_03785 [Oscillospiraceae bacterium]